ncbi:MAG TPA: aldo/keto reductase [Agriterribacter sp.]|nr:aldo/keto reductase [Agriterribacter sp.]
MNRSNFIKSTAGLAGFLALGNVSKAAAIIGRKQQSISTDNKVPLITLNNGTTIPQLGFGTWTLTDKPGQYVRQAIEVGFRLIDTAQGYQNEAGVGQGIKDSGIDRKDIFLTTKIGPDVMRNRTVKQSIDTSLEKLGSEYIDLMLIHWPVKEHIRETWQIMEDYVNKGLIKSIGLSNFNPHHIDDLLKYAKIKPVLNQIENHPTFSNMENTGITLYKDIAVECWSPLASGKDLDNTVLTSLAKKYNKSVAQIILRWDMQRGLISVTRSTKVHHMKEDINIFDFELSPADMSIINGVNLNQRTNAKNDPENFPW